ncbi:MAG: PBP1A family penicillin-binding protein [Acidobacteria bacterium]|nr:PBP1A family penicillin-binding protein [Acidobacteriota bacterium]
MRVIIKRSGRLRAPYRSLGAATMALLALLLVGGAAVFTFYYVRYSRIIDELLNGPVFPHVAQVYAKPEVLRVGEKTTVPEVLAYLRSAGLTGKRDNPKGSYSTLSDGLRIVPGEASYFAQEPAEIRFADGQISSIISLRDQLARSQYSLEPVLVTNLFGKTREKRRLVPFSDLPTNLVNAILAIEDRRFFQHSGVDYLRILKAAYVDFRARRVQQGASTITMQLARSLFLTPQRTFKRKAEETLVAFQMERRLSKQEIFEYYCNKVYLGQRGGFSISGFGEAAQSYFGKDIRDLTLPEAAFLAGIIRGPNLYSPHRNPEAAVRRRNQVLQAMFDTEAISAKERDEAIATPLKVVPSYGVANEAPYYVDMVKDQLLQNYSEEDLISDNYRIYTTLDPNLQRAAVEAMRIGMVEVDERLAALNKARRRRKDAAELPPPEQAEAALIVLDPRTGAVKALLGGRDYGRSQLNRVLAKRQPGSAFKPFVYAAALSTAIYSPPGQGLTAVSRVTDEPTTFLFDGREYQPANFKKEYFGNVTLRYALAHSLNVATVKIAEMTGYGNIVALARRAGMNLQIQPTPAVALGAYEVKPIEIAGAYTIFANNGVHMDPYLISTVHDSFGMVLEQTDPKPSPVLDPRVSFLMTSLMQSVIDRGTGNGVRSRGFRAPAAGKTGTSHDGWFAGYTSNLICVVWVGYDSNKEFPLTGAASALPIWTEFMKRAISFPQYRNVTAPSVPPGVIQVQIDADTGELATPNCPHTQAEYFLGGTEPTTYCPLHNLQHLPRVAGLDRIATVAPPPVLAAPPPVVQQHPPTASPAPIPAAAAAPTTAAEPVDKPKKRGFFGRIIGIFKGKPQTEIQEDPQR